MTNKPLDGVDGFDKVNKGMTTVDEILRVTESDH